MEHTMDSVNIRVSCSLINFESRRPATVVVEIAMKLKLTLKGQKSSVVKTVHWYSRALEVGYQRQHLMAYNLL